MGTLLSTIIVFAIGLLVLILPVMWAAKAMAASRTGPVWCVVALVVAYILHGFGLTIPILGNIGAFLLASAGFAVILGTSFVRGIGIAVLHIVFSTIIAMGMAALFGISLPMLVV